jgi:hypothetical protein
MHTGKCPRHALGLGHHPQHIGAGDLGNVRIGGTSRG